MFLFLDFRSHLVLVSYTLKLHCFDDRIGPEKGVIHIATGAVDNALWDLYAKARGKPLWKLLVDMSPVSQPHPNRTRFLPTHVYFPTGGASEVCHVSLYH